MIYTHSGSSRAVKLQLIVGPMSSARNQQKFSEDLPSQYGNERGLNAQELNNHCGRIANDFDLVAGDNNVVKGVVEAERLQSDTFDHEFQLSTSLQPSEDYEVRDKLIYGFL